MRLVTRWPSCLGNSSLSNLIVDLTFDQDIDYFADFTVNTVVDHPHAYRQPDGQLCLIAVSRCLKMKYLIIAGQPM